MATESLTYDQYDALLQWASVNRSLTCGDDLHEHDTGQWAAGTYHLGDGRTVVVHLGGTATLTTPGDQTPEPAADPLVGARCPKCNGLPSISTGLPAYLTFADDGGFTIGCDTAELGCSEVDEVQWAHTDACPGLTDAERYDVAAVVLTLAGRAAALVAPECDGNL